MYKLIATDMDKTLLNSNHEISLENKKAITKAIEKGVHFVLASGRPTGAMTYYAKELALDKVGGYIVSFNGAMITECKTNKVISKKGLSENEVKYLYKKALEYNTSLVTYIDSHIYALNYNPYVEIEKDYTNMEIKKIENINELDFSNIMKCMMVDNPEKIKEIYSSMEKTDKNNFFLAISDPHFLEIANKDVDKGKALTYLVNSLNLDLKDVIACGDSYNDATMLKIAGLPVAAENAVPYIKDICKYISKHHDEHLLEDIIHKYILL